MKVALVWSTPNEIDPNRYLRPLIERALRKRVTLEVFDSTFPMGSFGKMHYDLVLVVGTLLTLQLQVIDLITSKKRSKVFFWNFEDPYDFDFTRQWELRFDHIFTVEKKAIPYYRNASVTYLPLAGDLDSHSRKPASQREKGVLIAGSDYQRRSQLTDRLAIMLPQLPIWRVGNSSSVIPNVKKTGRVDNARLADLDSLASFSLVIGREFDFSNNEMSVPAGSPGPRIFEALHANGRLLVDLFTIDLHDTNPDLVEFVMFFDSMESLVNQILNPNQSTFENADDRAAWMQKHHTYDNRVQTILKQLKEH
jgi:spore maturation protein CgeB